MYVKLTEYMEARSQRSVRVKIANDKGQENVDGKKSDNGVIAGESKESRGKEDSIK
jgi:hypothetical protein